MPAQSTTLSRDARGEPVPDAWERARPPAADSNRLIGWLAPLAVALVALGLRLWNLGSPKVFAFDETYYAKDAWSLLRFGYVRGYADEPDDKILAGDTTGQWIGEPSMAVHPEVGKWMIAAGEKAFGMDPFGWRISAVVVGALMVLVLCRLVRRMTGSTLVGCLAGLLLCFDGLQFVLSRLALLDIFLAFWILLAVHCLVADRQWMRARIAALTREARDSPDSRDSGALGRWGPVRGLLFRPWLLASGVCWGLAIGTKWTALYPLAAFGIVVWLWSAGARRSFGVRGAWWRSALTDGPIAFAHLVLVAVVVYVASWTGWLVNASQYEEHLSQTQYRQFVSYSGCKDGEMTGLKLDKDKKWPTADEPDARGLGEVSQSLRSLWYYHQDLYTFHTNFLNCSTHTYGSKPRGWLVLNRPVGVAATNDIKPGEDGCRAAEGSSCLRQVLLLGNPAVWWVATAALLIGVVLWVARRDWRWTVPLVGVGSTWLPWFAYDDRPIFLFYAMASLPFAVIGLALVLGSLIEGPAGSRRRTAGVIAVGTYVVLVMLLFAWFWPVWTHELLTRAEWTDRIWFRRWI